MVSKILIFTFIVGTVSAATYFGKVPEKPAHLSHKQGCFISEIKDVIPFDTMVSPIGKCVRIHCSPGGMDYATCGVISTDEPKCHITKTDLSKPYPACCPDIKCDTDNNII